MLNGAAVRERVAILPRRMPAEHLRLLLEKAEAVGLSSTLLLRQCKLSFSLRDLQSGQIEALSVSEFARICQLCFMEIRRAMAPEPRSMSREDFDLMCYSLVSSTSLREVVEREARFFEMCERRYGWFTIEEADDAVTIGPNLGPVEKAWEAFFTLNAFLVHTRFWEWLIGERIPARFELGGEPTDEARRIAEIFGLPVKFGADASTISFPAHYLDKPVVRDARELRQLLSSFPYDVAIPAEAESSLSARVAAVFRDAILNKRDLPSLVDMARRIGMANATFRRHLDAEGESIRSIKAQVRAELACELLAADNVYIDQVASALGFSSPKAFGRAFFAWNGVTPAAYRREALRSRALAPEARTPWESAGADFASRAAGGHRVGAGRARH